MATIRRFEDMEIWMISRELAKKVFMLSCVQPFAKDFRHRDQINDSAGSIADNIAEGFERGGRAEFINFLSIAKGSSGETRSQLFRAFDKKYISEVDNNELQEKYVELGSKIGKLINYLNGSDIKGRKFKDRKSINSKRQTLNPKQVDSKL